MLSKNLENSLHRALSIAQEMQNEYATLEHLMLALLDDEDARHVLMGCGANIQVLRDKLKNFLINTSHVNSTSSEIKPAFSFQRVIHKAAIHVHASGKSEIRGSHVLIENTGRTQFILHIFST